jgi:16S rRNA G1207 methylase RsmC
MTKQGEIQMKNNVWKFVSSNNNDMSKVLNGKFCVVKAQAGSHAKFIILQTEDTFSSVETSTVSSVMNNLETLTVKTANSVYTFERVDIYSLCRA